MFGGSQHLLGNGCSRGSCLCSGLAEVRGNVSTQSLVVFRTLLTAIAGEPQVTPGMTLPLSSGGEYGQAESAVMHVGGFLGDG